MPVTKADKSVDTVDDSYRPRNALDKDNWDACEYPVHPPKLACLPDVADRYAVVQMTQGSTTVLR